MLSKELRDSINSQIGDEILFARNAKKAKMANWHLNEDLYYSNKRQISDERANVNLNEAQGFVQTFLSKINSPYNFKYVKGEEADLSAANVANALLEKDRKSGYWNYKVMLARVQLAIYGRYIFEYHADSTNGYKSYLSNTDVYQFLIDPSCGGLDVEQAFYMGRGGILKSKSALKLGVKKGKYLRTEVNEIISGAGNLTSDTDEDTEASNRYTTSVSGDKNMERPDVWKFLEWYTTYEDERYYALYNEDSGKAVRIEKLEDMFANNQFPFFSAAAFPDITEFWTPSPLDGVREAIMAKSISINQMLDNGEAINRPMKAFDVSAVKNPALLKYRKDGLIPFKAGVDIDKALKFFPVTPITTAITVYEKLNEITDVNSGITSAAKGYAEEKAVGIYEGNMQNASDRFMLISDSEAMAQQRFAELYLAGLDEHLTKKVAVEMIGIDGVKFKKVSNKDLKRKSELDVIVVSSGREERMKDAEKRNKLTFLSAKSADQTGTYNKKVLSEMEATLVGFNNDEIKYMLDTKNDGSAELMSECAYDIQQLLKDKYIEPNDMANTAYMQKVKDYMRDESEYFVEHPNTYAVFADYMNRIEPVVIRNMTDLANKEIMKQGMPSLGGQAMGMKSAPMDQEEPESTATPAVDQQTMVNYGKV